MTADEIRALPAGPALNQRIALEVMQYTMYHYDKDVASACYWMLFDEEGDEVEPPTVPYHKIQHPTEADAWAACPDFSGDLGAALLVWFRMLTRVGECNIQASMEDYGREPGPVVWVTIGEALEFGPLPLAVCHAALRALELERNPPAPEIG